MRSSVFGRSTAWLVLAAALASAAPVHPGMQRSGTPRQALSACTDPYDPNQSCATAVALAPGLYPSLVIEGPWTAIFEEDWYRIHVPQNMKVVVDLQFSGAAGDIDMFLYPDCVGSFVALSTGVGDTEHLEYVHADPAQDYSLRVYNLDPTCNSYTMYVQVIPAANIGHALPAGWSQPMVIRNDTFAACDLAFHSPTLDGNAATTNVSLSFSVTGPASVPQFSSPVALDGAWLGNPLVSDDPQVPGVFCFPNQFEQVPVRGGRHTLVQYLDFGDDVAEGDEADNFSLAQLVWSPLPIAFETPIVRAAPPDPGFLYPPNDDGFSFSRSSGVAWVTSIAAVEPNDDYDLAVYDDYSGSESGFSNQLAMSERGGNATDFVVGHYSGTPLTVYPAAIRFYETGPGDSYCADATDARFRNGPGGGGDADWLAQTMAAHRLADVYEHYIPAGGTVHVSLRRLGGPSHLEFRVFPGTGGGIYHSLEGTPSTAMSPSFEVLTFTNTSGFDGWHPIVVHRSEGTDAGEPVTYDLRVNATGLVDATAITATADFSFLGAVPNPVRDRTVFEFVMPAGGQARLVLYDVGGRRLRTLLDATVGAGRKLVAWDRLGDSGEPVPSGIYLARLEAAGRVVTRRVSVIE